jgi:hypothetical protein
MFGNRLTQTNVWFKMQIEYAFEVNYADSKIYLF